MSEANKALARRWFEEVWNKSRREAIAEMLAPNAVLHEAGQASQGPEGFYPFFDRMQAAFSDMHVTIHDALSDGDRVCLRWSCSMRHTGDGLGMPPTNKHLEITGISIVQIKDGRFVQGWQNWDMMALMEQIHAKPMGATYVAARA